MSMQIVREHLVVVFKVVGFGVMVGLDVGFGVLVGFLVGFTVVGLGVGDGDEHGGMVGLVSGLHVS
jgi:hypothetical protein